MADETVTAEVENQPMLMLVLGTFAVIGCGIFIGTILIADFVVPNHDWVEDTISDLGAGRYEFIVDTGIYAFSASLVGIAILAAHVHLGGWAWSAGVVSLALLGLIVFLLGARNEYGDNDNDGVVIHVYLVYALGFLFTAVPFAMAHGAGRAGRRYRQILIGLGLLWALSAPVFFFLPTSVDGLYERYLGLVAMAIVVTLARLFIARGQKLRREAMIDALVGD